MNWGTVIPALWRGIILSAAIIVCGLLTPAQGRADDVMLLLEQSPTKGGDISPVAGKYFLEPNSQVTLTAVPKPGYQFLHWLGDVSDPTATKTVVHLDKPKIIIAVFKKNPNRLHEQVGGPTGGGAGGALFSTPADLSWPGGFSGGGGTRLTVPPPTNIPVGGNQPVPEPATGALLLIGGLIALRQRNPKKS